MKLLWDDIVKEINNNRTDLCTFAAILIYEPDVGS